MLLPRHSITSESASLVATNIRFTSPDTDAANTAFACATQHGFFVQSINPYREAYRRDFMDHGGLRLAVPVSDTSLVLLVGNERSGPFPSNALTLWDDQFLLERARSTAEEPTAPRPEPSTERPVESPTPTPPRPQPTSPVSDLTTSQPPGPPTFTADLHGFDLLTEPRPDTALMLDPTLRAPPRSSPLSSNSGSTGSLVSAASISSSRHQLGPDISAQSDNQDESLDAQAPSSPWNQDSYDIPRAAIAEEQGAEGATASPPGSPDLSDGTYDFAHLTAARVVSPTGSLEQPAVPSRTASATGLATGSATRDRLHDTVLTGSPFVGNELEAQSKYEVQDIPDLVDIDEVEQVDPPVLQPLASGAPSAVATANSASSLTAVSQSPPPPTSDLPTFPSQVILQDASRTPSPGSTHETPTLHTCTEETASLAPVAPPPVQFSFTPQRSPTTSHPSSPAGSLSTSQPLLSASVSSQQDMAADSAADPHQPMHFLEASGLTSKQDNIVSVLATGTSSTEAGRSLAHEHDNDHTDSLTQQLHDAHREPQRPEELTPRLDQEPLVAQPSNDDLGSDSGSEPAMFMSVMDPHAGRSMLVPPGLSRSSSHASFASVSPADTPVPNQGQMSTDGPMQPSSSNPLAQSMASATLALPVNLPCSFRPELSTPVQTPTAVQDAGSDSDDSSIGVGRCAPTAHSEALPVSLSAQGLDSIVAQLEWDEPVRNAYARAFHFGPSRSHGPHTDPTTRPTAKLRRPAQTYVVIVVVLRSKAVLLEVGPFESQQPSDKQASGFSPLPDWTITEKLVTAISDTPQGLGAISQVEGHVGQAIVVLTGRQAGHVQLIHLSVGPVAHATRSHGPTAIIAAHASPLAALALSPCGTLLATMSDKGTLVRIWSTVQSLDKKSEHGSKFKIGLRKVRELRRGLDTAKIHNISFSPNARWLAVVSETGTIHMFCILDAPSDTTKLPSSVPPTQQDSKSKSHQKSRFGGSLSRVVPPSIIPRYFSSEWSSALFRLRLTSFAPPPSSKTYVPATAEEDNSMQTGYGDAIPPSPADWVKVASKGKEPTAAGPTREGQWASIRQRISSARKGQAAIDERVVLGWIPTIVTPTNSSTVVEPYQLVAATTAGHYYRITLDPPSLTSGSTATAANPVFTTTTTGPDDQESIEEAEEDLVLSMYRHSSKAQASSTSSPRSGQAKGKQRSEASAPADADEEALTGSKRCRLEEYRSFDQTDGFGISHTG